MKLWAASRHFRCCRKDKNQPVSSFQRVSGAPPQFDVTDGLASVSEQVHKLLPGVHVFVPARTEDTPIHAEPRRKREDAPAKTFKRYFRVHYGVQKGSKHFSFEGRDGVDALIPPPCGDKRNCSR